MNDSIFFYDDFMSGLKRFEFPGLAFYRKSCLPATVHGRLFDCGGRPGMVETKARAGMVHGEVHVFGDVERILRITDRLENVNKLKPEQGLFIRTEIRVHIKGSSTAVATWAYIYNGNISGLKVIPGGDWRRIASRE
jgi:gamma-glutamylcyclotransferase (GGCT)/AIG2-like uncharacterized protein YtfP